MIFRLRPVAILAGLAAFAAGDVAAQELKDFPLPPPLLVSPSPPAEQTPVRTGQTVQKSPSAQAAPRPAPVPPPPPAQEAAPQPERIANPIAEFSGLDKVTGRIFAFEVKVDETVQFGALQVTPRVCYTRPPTEQPETIAFVEVDEITLQNEQKRIFAGWMFADSPGLNAVEHPIYDVWVTNCKGGERREAPEAPKLGE